MVLHLPDGHSAAQVRDALITAFAALPGDLALTLTWDQDGEMAASRIHGRYAVRVYFSQPGSPWQRGSDENLNGLLRQYFPKGTALGADNAEHLAQVAKQLNSRPRRCLGWSTPTQRLAKPIPTTRPPGLLRRLLKAAQQSPQPYRTRRPTASRVPKVSGQNT
ncbi:IS30 family transposase [Micromonospora sp. NPDC051141]|uniref:IS30 family transposase n=1 Tax=Micromonospora sp. NPDC051141 TaxID=3364284 RepID=UPI00379779BF